MNDRNTPPAKRQRLARLPRWLQRPLTWLSGLSSPADPPPWRWTPQQHLIAYFATLVLAGACGVYTVQNIVQQTGAFGLAVRVID